MHGKATLLGLFVGVGVIACGDGPSVAESLKQMDEADAKKKAKEASEKAAVKPREKDPNALELPWSFDQVKGALKGGTSMTYAMTGTDAKGKAVSDTFNCRVTLNESASVGVVAYRESQKDDPAVSQTQTFSWSKLSPFFALEKTESKVVRRESVTVPAGTFDNCVVAELTGFFGGRHTVWMVPEKPGVYAKVVDHGKSAPGEQSKFEVIYQLKSLELPK